MLLLSAAPCAAGALPSRQPEASRILQTHGELLCDDAFPVWISARRGRETGREVVGEKLSGHLLDAVNDGQRCALTKALLLPDRICQEEPGDYGKARALNEACHFIFGQQIRPLCESGAFISEQRRLCFWTSCDPLGGRFSSPESRKCRRP